MAKFNQSERISKTVRGEKNRNKTIKELKDDLRIQNDILLLQEMDKCLKRAEGVIKQYRDCTNKRLRGICDILDGKVTSMQLSKIPLPGLPYDYNALAKIGLNLSQLSVLYNSRLSIIEDWSN